MTENDILEILIRRLNEPGQTQSGLARVIGISPQYLQDVIKLRRSPGPKILEYLRIEKRETYVRVRA